MSSSVKAAQSLLQMLPYEASTKKNKDLLAGLKDYSLLLNVSLDAVEALENGDLERFDAIVGENACEIRAVWVALIAKQGLDYISSLKNALKRADASLKSLLDKRTIDKLMGSGRSLQDVIQDSKHQLDIALTLHQTVLIESFLLTQVRAPRDPKAPPSITIKNKADPNKLKKYQKEATGKFLDALVSKVKGQLSALSVQFVRESAAETRCESLIEATSTQLTYLQYLTCVPMFPTYQSMILKARREGIPLILHAKFVNERLETEDDAYLYFDGSKDQPYLRTKPLSSDLLKSAWMMEGVVCADKKGKRLSKAEWLQQMEGQSIENVILKGAANHRQFPDDRVNYSTDELARYSQQALETGCAFDNPTLFFINHVFPVQVGKVPAIVNQVGIGALPKPCESSTLTVFGSSGTPYSKFSPKQLAPYVPSPA